MDLLLFLVRRHEVDLTRIPVSDICDSYLGFLQRVDQIDVEVAGEFLVMAATLIELKSRTIAPLFDLDGKNDDDSDGSDRPDVEADPRDELIRQLLAYQRIRLAAEHLDARRMELACCAPRALSRAVRDGVTHDADSAREPIELIIEDALPIDVAEAWERIGSTVDFNRLGEHVIEMDDTPLILHQEDLIDRLTRSGSGRMSLQAAFAGAPPMKRIGLFLATLELARNRQVRVIQDDIEDTIELVLVDEADMDDAARALAVAIPEATPTAGAATAGTTGQPA